VVCRAPDPRTRSGLLTSALHRPITVKLGRNRTRFAPNSLCVTLGATIPRTSGAQLPIATQTSVAVLGTAEMPLSPNSVYTCNNTCPFTAETTGAYSDYTRSLGEGSPAPSSTSSWTTF